MRILGMEVRYVTKTPFGNFVLPAVHVADVDPGNEFGISRVKIFTDVSGGSEWITEVPYSKEKCPETWHMVND